MGNSKDILRLRAEGVEKSYWLKPHKIDILKGVDLSVAPGEKVAIAGMSGAGKSTLLHILGALDNPDKGTVYMDGEDLGGMSARKKALLRAHKIGFIFQSYNLLYEMDTVENVMLPAMACSDAAVTGRKYRNKAIALLEKVGVGARLDHLPLELSGGEQQRVAIARALMNDPVLVLADEPTGNLDDVTGGQILDLLFSMASGSGTSLVIVTHSEKVAAACDRRIDLVDGVLAG